MLHTVGYHLFNAKRKLALLALGSSGGYLVHVGIIQPVALGDIRRVDGSNEVQDKRKNSLDIVSHTGHRPSYENPLRVNDVKDNHGVFSSEIRELIKDAKDVEPRWERKDVSHDYYILRTAYDIESYSSTTESTVSTVDIPFRSQKLIEEASGFGKGKLVKDILYSLAEEGEFNGTIIRPGSISVGMDLDINTLPKEKIFNSFPLPATRVNNFNLKFKVFNPTPRPKTALKGLELDPHSESEITITLPRSELRPVSKSRTPHEFKAVSWGLFPTMGSQWNITQLKYYPTNSIKKYSRASLDLLFNGSKFFDRWLGNSKEKKINSEKFAYPWMTFADVKRITFPYLTGITKDNIKKDIEMWYGGYAVHSHRMKFEDMVNFLKTLVNETLITDKHHKPTSILKRALEDGDFRDSYYKQSRVAPNIRKILDAIFKNMNDEKNSDKKITFEEIEAMIKSWIYQAEKIREALKVTITWEQEPTTSSAGVHNNSPFPSVSFKFKQKLEWTEDIEIPLNGKYNKKEKKYEKSSSSSSSSSSTTDSIEFKIGQKLSKISDILAPLKQGIIPNDIGGINVFNTLLPQAEEFIDLDVFEIEKNESIENTYHAQNSPISPSITHPEDNWDRNMMSATVGWKALDVKASHDYSNFHKLLEKIYKKISEKGTNDTFGVSQLLNVATTGKEKPIETIAKLINTLFKQDSGKTKPWETFFQKLTKQAWTFDSTQLFFGYSSSMYSVEDKYHEALKCSEDSQRAKRSTNTKSNNNPKFCSKKDITSELQTHKIEDIARPKNANIKSISDKFSFSFSAFQPELSMYFGEANKTPEFERFLKNEGNSTLSFQLNKDKLKNVFRSKYSVNISHHTHSQKAGYLYFPDPNLIDWESTKLSYVQLNIKDAINSVLQLKNQATGFLVTIALSAAGLEIPKLLGDALERDLFVVTLNLLKNEGSFVMRTMPNKKITYSPLSVDSITITPSFNKSKLKLGNIKI